MSTTSVSFCFVDFFLLTRFPDYLRTLKVVLGLYFLMQYFTLTSIIFIQLLDKTKFFKKDSKGLVLYRIKIS